MLNITNCSTFGLTRVSRPPITNSRSMLVIIAVALCLVAALTLFLNAVVVVAVYKSSHPDRRPSLGRGAGSNTRVVRLLMASMAVADAVVAVVLMPVRITELVHNGEWIFPMFMCKFRTLASVYLCTVSVYHVMGMAIDRYMAICKPMSYRLLTVRTARIMAGLFWIIPVFLYILPIVGKWIFILKPDNGCEPGIHGCKTGMHEVFSVVGAVFSFYVPFLVIFVLYSIVLLEVRNFHNGNRRALSKKILFRKIFRRSSNTSNDMHENENHTEGHLELHNNCTLSKSDNSSSITLGKASESLITVDSKTSFTLSTSMRKSGKRTNSTKALLTIGLIVITFTVTWLPFSVFKVIFGVRRDVVFPSWIYNVTLWMGYFNSTLNPILFCLHKGIRLSVKKLLFPKSDS